MRGRPTKTDRRGRQWVHRLCGVGLSAAAFRPDEETCRRWAFLRQRADLVREASRHVQNMQKALEQTSLKLTEVLSDATGLTGRAIIRAVHRGIRAPENLPEHRGKGCKASETEIVQGLTGSYREESLFELMLAREVRQFTLGQISQVGGQIASQLGRKGQVEYKARMRENQVQALRRKVRQMGLELVAMPSGGVPKATAVPVQG